MAENRNYKVVFYENGTYDATRIELGEALVLDSQNKPVGIIPFGIFKWWKFYLLNVPDNISQKQVQKISSEIAKHIKASER